MYSLGTTKVVNGVSSGITAFGSTNAPIAIDSWDVVMVRAREAFEADGDGFETRTTLAKWVGTEIEGGLPMTSWVCRSERDGVAKVVEKGGRWQGGRRAMRKAARQARGKSRRGKAARRTKDPA